MISGTALLVDGTHPSVRAKVQGSVDVFVALAGASGGAMSGMVASGMSFSWLSLLGGFLALSSCLLCFGLSILERQKKDKETESDHSPFLYR
ncbi:hypothetical protein [Geomicrobium sp. JCM 19038]|uniref:hypothetical protein n=1 Tax=Geomicrobium sp. JCM 19038 TaxID=1460635 RepID=UPI000A9E4B25